MEESLELDPFNLIICRYNELGLKSRRVRARMEHRLIDHIVKICIREKLLIVSQKHEWGRFIFEFLPQDMSKAILIFKHIIGLHSFSPAIKLSNEYSVIVSKVKKFAHQYFHKGDTFVIRARRVKSYSKTSSEIERELGEYILNSFIEEGRSNDIKVKLKNPDKTIFVEVRENWAYIFSSMVKTMWGGNPIEIDKPMLSLWKGEFGENVASQLMIRRGSIVFPVLLTLNSEKIFDSPLAIDDILIKIHQVAKFIPEPLTVIRLNVSALETYLSTISDVNKLSIFKNYACLYLMDILGRELNINQELSFNKKKVKLKGMITPSTLSNELKYTFGQYFTLPHFMPIIGLSTEMIKNMDEQLEDKRPSYDIDTFDVADVVLDHDLDDSVSQTINPESEISNSFSLNSSNVQKLLDNSKLLEILDCIIQKRTKFAITPTIL
jgi:tRNA uracil 4-sulfurtransferase